MTTTMQALRTGGYEVTRANEIETLEDVKLWIADNDARNGERWKQQGGTNKRVDIRLADGERRLTSIEKRVMWFAGAMALAGAIGGTVVASLIGA